MVGGSGRRAARRGAAALLGAHAVWAGAAGWRALHVPLPADIEYALLVGVPLVLAAPALAAVAWVTAFEPRLPFTVPVAALAVVTAFESAAVDRYAGAAALLPGVLGGLCAVVVLAGGLVGTLAPRGIPEGPAPGDG